MKKNEGKGSVKRFDYPDEEDYRLCDVLPIPPYPKETDARKRKEGKTKSKKRKA